MKPGDLERTTRGRFFLNTYLIPRLANLMQTGDEVLFIGTDTSWDYKPFFFNPSKLCTYTTIDVAERYNPDIVGDIQNCPQIENDRFSLILMIGIYEFLDHIPEAFAEMKRILKPDGYLMVAFPGKGYYPDHRGANIPEIYEVMKDYRILEIYNLYEGNKEPNSVCVLAQKI